MRRARAHLECILRLCRTNDAQYKAQGLPDNLMHNQIKFWEKNQSHLNQAKDHLDSGNYSINQLKSLQSSQNY